MKKERTNAIIESAESMFGATVLWRSIGAGETKGRAMCGEESTDG